MHSDSAEHHERQAWIPIAKNIEKGIHFPGLGHAAYRKTNGKNQTCDKCREC
jgi:hypothetical protein